MKPLNTCSRSGRHQGKTSRERFPLIIPFKENIIIYYYIIIYW